MPAQQPQLYPAQLHGPRLCRKLCADVSGCSVCKSKNEMVKFLLLSMICASDKVDESFLVARL